MISLVEKGVTNVFGSKEELKYQTVVQLIAIQVVTATENKERTPYTQDNVPLRVSLDVSPCGDIATDGTGPSSRDSESTLEGF